MEIVFEVGKYFRTHKSELLKSDFWMAFIFDEFDKEGELLKASYDA